MMYVTQLMPCERTKKWRYQEVAYLVADTMRELHHSAMVVGLKRQWFTGHAYKLTRARQRYALRMGAKLLTDANEMTKIARKMVDGQV